MLNIIKMFVKTVGTLVGIVLLLNVITAVEQKFCAPGDNRDGCVQCPLDKTWAECDVDPCVREQELGCPLHKEAVCKSNQCGGCFDEWYLPDGMRVWCWAH